MADAPEKSPGRLRAAATISLGALRASPLRAVGMLVLLLASTVAETGTFWFVKLAIDAAFAGDAGRAAAMAVGIGVATALAHSFGWLEFTLRVPLVERTGLMFEEELIRLTTSIPDIEHHERPEYLDRLEQLRDGRYALGLTVTVLAFNVGTLSSFAATMLLLASVHPVLLALPLAGAASFFTGVRSHKVWRAVGEATTERQRAARHLFEVGTTAASGKELRIFGLRDELLRKHRDLSADVAQELQTARTRIALWNTAGWTVFSLSYIAAIALVVRLAASGRASAGDVALALTLAAQVNSQVSQFVGVFRWLMEILLTISRFLWLREYASERTAAHADPAPAPSLLAEGIRLDGVEFTYPSADSPVLAGVDLFLPAGSTVALVGENGAGKSTLVKLLCRFYDPSAGAVLVDGVDLRRIPAEEWRTRLSAGFQDFMKFELVLREAVTVGDLDRLEDRDAATSAMERAGAGDLLRVLPDALDTRLGLSMEGGRELSGGQWQKVALGRALVREQPLLLVLDEPTAALDAETEHTLFERYAGAAREVASATGGITVLVSHRFSTVAMADLVIVVHEGRVAECGSHDELMAASGLYAELYGLQARSYR